MKQISRIGFWDIDNDGNNSIFWVLLEKINELVEEVNRLGMVNFPVTDLDDTSNNCEACGHIHQNCKCGCNES